MDYRYTIQEPFINHICEWAVGGSSQVSKFHNCFFPVTTNMSNLYNYHQILVKMMPELRRSFKNVHPKPMGFNTKVVIHDLVLDGFQH